MKFSHLLALGIVATLLGCQSASSDDEEQKGNGTITVTATGKVNPELVGGWKTADGKMTIDLDKEGSVHLVSDLDTGRGLQHTVVDGKWTVDGEDFYIESKKKDQTTTEKYQWKLEGGKTLVLIRKFPKFEMRYNRS